MQRAVPIWEAGYSIKEHWREARARLWDDFEQYSIRMSEVRGRIYVQTRGRGMLEVEGTEVMLSRARKFAKGQREESMRIAREKVQKRNRAQKEEKQERQYFEQQSDNMLLYQTNGHMWRCTLGNCCCPEKDLMDAKYEGVVSNKGEVRKLPLIERTSSEMLLERPVKMSRKQIETFYGKVTVEAPHQN